MTASTSVRKVAVALFEGFTVLDVYGPVQAFASARLTGPDGARIRLFEIFTMAERRGEVKSSEGPATHADFSFGDAPDFDILLIPGGFGSRTQVERPQFLSELARASERARPIQLAVFLGVAYVVGVRLLHPHAARFAFRDRRTKLALHVKQGPRVHWQRKARWVDDGNILTSSGVSAGIDMALSLVARLHGRDLALVSARNMEYVWHEDPADDPFA